MLIKCPKCRSVYDLPDNLIPDEGLKMRCSECSEIWTGYPEDALKKVNITTKNIQKMFNRISKNTDDLFVEEAPRHSITANDTTKIDNVHKKSAYWNITLIVLTVLSVILFFYAFRYDVVRLLPQTENLYSKINVSSVQYGTNLELNNISTKEFIENHISQLEISGTITNTGKYVTELPPVKIDIFDKKGKLLLTVEKELSLPRLEAGYHILFNVVVTNPTPYAKSVYVTLKDKNN